MRIHYLQHVAFEGPGSIRDWAELNGHDVTGTRLDLGEALPAVADFDVLVIMGGPMSVNDEAEWPWLVPEKQLVRDTIAAGKPILGVCLGAQLIASALGKGVYRGKEKEIGWLPVQRVDVRGVAALWPETFTPLHWHGETFDLPEGAWHLARTPSVPNQAFELPRRVIGLQFHLEATAASVEALVAHASDDITGGRHQQSPERILADVAECEAVRPLLHRLLDYLTSAG